MNENRCDSPRTSACREVEKKKLQICTIANPSSETRTHRTERHRFLDFGIQRRKLCMRKMRTSGSGLMKTTTKWKKKTKKNESRVHTRYTYSRIARLPVRPSSRPYQRGRKARWVDDDLHLPIQYGAVSHAQEDREKEEVEKQKPTTKRNAE